MTARAPAEDVGEGLARIRAALEAGETDLRSLGFWRLVERVKADPTQVAGRADEVGRIDRAAFEALVRFRVPVWVGNGVLLLGTAVGGAAVATALATDSSVVAGIALLAAGGVWSVTLHDLAHWAVGRAVGIRFVAYFIGWRPPPPRPGLKTDYATYLRASPRGRAWMHASGAIATKLAPLAALAFWPATPAPGWAAFGLVGFAAFAVVTDLLFSFRLSDWKKVRRELRVGRRIAAR